MVARRTWLAGDSILLNLVRGSGSEAARLIGKDGKAEIDGCVEIEAGSRRPPSRNNIPPPPCSAAAYPPSNLLESESRTLEL